MARIAGVDLPRDKRIEYALPYIYGIGLTLSRELGDVYKRQIDGDYKVEGDLRREESLNIKRLIEIGSYRGRRHRMGLPVRGQNTKNNARTRKGPKRTIAGKKK